MLITKKSRLTGKTHTKDIPMTEEQVKRFNSGELIQRVFPELPADDREFLLTGITKEEWDAAFPEEE